MQQDSDFTRGFNLGWLAAAIDYEGSIGIRVLRMAKNKPKQFALHPYVEVYNTNPRLVTKIREITGFGYVRTENYRKKEQHKFKIVYAVNSRAEIVKLLELVEPYLQAKRENACLLLQFCRSRLKAMAAPNFRKPHIGSTPYSQEELRWAIQLRALVAKSGSSRQSHKLAGF